MKSLKLCTAATLLTYAAFAQNEKVITVDAFDKIVIRNSVTGTITQGLENSIRVSEDVPGFTYSVKNGTLILEGVSPKNLNITFKELNDLKVSGVATLTSTGLIKADDLDIDISGSGKLNLGIEANNVKANISGVTKMELKGSAANFEIDISGSGKIYAEDFLVKNAIYNISGTGTAYTSVSDSLTANISGSGTVYYKDEPKKISSDISGIGKIRKANSSTTSMDTTKIQFGNNSVTIVTDNDSTKIYSGNKTRKATGHWSGLDIGFNGYVDKNNSNDVPAGYDFLELIPEKSIAVNLNIYDHDFKIFKQYVIATTGMGLSYNNFRFRKSFTLIPDTNRVAYTPDSIGYKKHKLTVSYVTVPLLLTFNTNEKYRKAFHITTGVLLSYKIGSHTKKVFDVEGNKKKEKEFDDFNIDPFRYDATVRVGYRNFTVFANYALSNFFKNNRGPELHPWAFGVSLTAW